MPVACSTAVLSFDNVFIRGLERSFSDRRKPPSDGDDDSLRTVTSPGVGPAPPVPPAPPANIARARAAPTDETPAQPERVSRYRIERVLCKGGFGLVYLGTEICPTAFAST